MSVQAIFLYNEFENHTFKLLPHISGSNELRVHLCPPGTNGLTITLPLTPGLIVLFSVVRLPMWAIQSSARGAPCGGDSDGALMKTSNFQLVLFFFVRCTPRFNKVERGYTGFILSVCPSTCLSVDGIVSALCLQQYSPDPFHIYTSYQATSEGVSCVIFFFSKFKNFGKFFKFVTLTLSCLTWDPI